MGSCERLPVERVDEFWGGEWRASRGVEVGARERLSVRRFDMRVCVCGVGRAPKSLKSRLTLSGFVILIREHARRHYSYTNCAYATSTSTSTTRPVPARSTVSVRPRVCLPSSALVLGLRTAPRTSVVTPSRWKMASATASTNAARSFLSQHTSTRIARVAWCGCAATGCHPAPNAYQLGTLWSRTVRRARRARRFAVEST